MINNSNLDKISNFIKKNNSFSDFTHVNNFLLNLNYTNLKFQNNNNYQKGSGYGYGYNYNNENLIKQQSVNMTNPQFTNQHLVQSENIMPIIPSHINQNQNQTNLQMLPDMNLQNPGYTTDYKNTYTIKEGTILFHATTNKKGFNTNYIELGKDKLINFFTPNFRLASDRIEGCSVDKQNGYIHVFRVKKDIPNIYIKLPYDIADDINSGTLANEFCSQNSNFSGIGFFYPKNNIEMFSNLLNNQLNQSNQFNESNYYSEFGICNPKPYLEYIYSQKCQSLRKLSQPFRFD